MMKKNVATILLVLLFATVIGPTLSFAKDDPCRSCKKDHKQICKDECEAFGKNKPRKQCHSECFTEKCASVCTKKDDPCKSCKDKKREACKTQCASAGEDEKRSCKKKCLTDQCAAECPEQKKKKAKKAA